jgi:hypothetical protein
MNGRAVAYVAAGLIVLGGVGEGVNATRDMFTVAATQPGGPRAPQGVVSPSPLPTVCPTVSEAKAGSFVPPCPQASALAKTKIHVHARLPIHHVPRVHRVLRVIHPRNWVRSYTRGF